jgi:hypothetical protein
MAARAGRDLVRAVDRALGGGQQQQQYGGPALAYAGAGAMPGAPEPTPLQQQLAEAGIQLNFQQQQVVERLGRWAAGAGHPARRTLPR